MFDTFVESELGLADTELNRRITLLEKTLQEKQQTVEALEDSERRYRRLFESATNSSTSIANWEQERCLKFTCPDYLGDAVEAGQKRAAEMPPPSRGETVLLVEDKPSLLTMGQMMLEELGYRVLAAGVPGEAIRLAEQNASEIKLLITDVVMPEMNGRDLAERFHSLCPGIKTLFMSGYTADVIAIRGVLDEDVYFLQKPFTMTDLAIKVRDALSEK